MRRSVGRRGLTRREIEGEVTTLMGAETAAPAANEITGEDFGDVAPPSVPEWLFGAAEKQS